MNEQPLKPDEIREMIHIAHEEGFAVMAHVNGAGPVLAALEAGADDMVNEGDSFVIYTDPADFTDVLTGMKDAGYEFVEADIERVPTVEATPKPEDLKRLSKMINLLEENEDVQKVHHNCAVELLDE